MNAPSNPTPKIASVPGSGTLSRFNWPLNVGVKDTSVEPRAVEQKPGEVGAGKRQIPSVDIHDLGAAQRPQRTAGTELPAGDVEHTADAGAQIPVDGTTTMKPCIPPHREVPRDVTAAHVESQQGSWLRTSPRMSPPCMSRLDPHELKESSMMLPFMSRMSNWGPADDAVDESAVDLEATDDATARARRACRDSRCSPPLSARRRLLCTPAKPTARRPGRRFARRDRDSAHDVAVTRNRHAKVIGRRNSRADDTAIDESLRDDVDHDAPVLSD